MGSDHQDLFQYCFDGNYNIQAFSTAPFSDTPWHPPNLTDPPISNVSLDQSIEIHASTNLQEYGIGPLLSECGTYHDDSGYGGSAPTIIGSAPSIHENDMSTKPGRVDFFVPLPVDDPRSSSRLGHLHANRAVSSKHFCNVCNVPLSTKAELNKHIQRHSKPHLCTYLDCSRAAKGCGFSTPNDLARHKRTVHKEHDRHGPVYVCLHEPCRNKKLKIWPRADNFRSHLNRQHSEAVKAEDDLQDYIYRPLSSPSLASRYDLHGNGQGLGSPVVGIDSNYRHPQLQDSPVLMGERAFPNASSPNPAPREQPHLEGLTIASFDDSTPRHDQPNASGDAGAYGHSGLANDWSVHEPPSDGLTGGLYQGLPSQDDAASDDAPASADYEDDIGRTSGVWASQEAAIGSCQLEMDELIVSPSDTEEPGCEPVSHLFANEFAKRLTEARSDPLRLVGILKKLPNDILELLQTALKDEQGPDGNDKKVARDGTDGREGTAREDAAPPKLHFVCSDCHKPFARPCELKKHRKRHDKPYGCTFKQCSKTFGSKNDWKRHESTQHFMLETWTCDMEGCQKVRHRRETFKNHLYRDHQFEINARVVEEKLEQCRMGRHCDPRFWCGFCGKIVEIEEVNVNSWKRRCDHIDNHLFGKNGLAKKVMSDWLYLDDDGEGTELSDMKEDEMEEEDEEDEEMEDGEDEDDGCEHGYQHDSSRGRKRRAAADDLETRRKKRRIEGTLMWHCCQCSNATGLVYKTSPSCVECQHRKCGDCCEERVMPMDEEAGQAAVGDSPSGYI